MKFRNPCGKERGKKQQTHDACEQEAAHTRTPLHLVKRVERQSTSATHIHTHVSETNSDEFSKSVWTSFAKTTSNPPRTCPRSRPHTHASPFGQASRASKHICNAHTHTCERNKQR